MLSKRIKRINILALVILAMLVFCVSIVFSAEPKELSVGFAAWSQLCPRDVAETEALKAYIKEINEQGKYKIDLKMTDAAGKREKIRADIEDLLVQEVDILIVMPIDTHDFLGWKELVMQSREETGKPLVYASSSKIPVEEDLSIEKIGVDFALATSDYNSGRLLGQHFAAYLFGKKGKYEGKVVELRGAPGTSADILRHGGFHSVLDQYPDIETIFEQTHNWSRMEALELTRVVLQKFPPGSFDALVAYFDDGAMGVLASTEEAGRVGEFLIYTSDGQSDCLREIQEGKITACAVYEHRHSKMCLEKALEIIEGNTVEKIIMPPDIFITTGNINTILGTVYTPYISGEDVDWDQVNK
jgi:ABC-type sugar transport system substrate-binding protein